MHPFYIGISISGQYGRIFRQVCWVLIIKTSSEGLHIIAFEPDNEAAVYPDSWISNYRFGCFEIRSAVYRGNTVLQYLKLPIYLTDLLLGCHTHCGGPLMQYYALLLFCRPK